MASNLEPKINRIATAVTSALSALTAKGVTVPEGANVESLASLIASIEAGGGGGNIVAGSFTPTSDVKTFKVNHNFNTRDICFVVFISENLANVDRGAAYSSFIDGRKSWVVRYNNNYSATMFGRASDPTITTESVDLTAFFYNSVFMGGSKYTYFVWKNGEV